MISSRYLICLNREQKLDCLDSGGYEIAARHNVDWQPSAQANKNVPQDDDP